MNGLVRELLSLPARHGGLGIINPVEMADCKHLSSFALTSRLVQGLLQERSHGDVTVLPPPSSKSELRQVRQRKLAGQAANLHRRLPPKLQFAQELASEKGASRWLTARPLAEHGFDIPKSAFRDALCLRYGWHIDRLPSHCVCGHEFSPDHAVQRVLCPLSATTTCATFSALSCLTSALMSPFSH